MKKTILFVLKTGLFILFIYNIGIFSYISNIEKTPPPPHKSDFGRADIDWLNEKYECARQLGEQYGPEQYFKDIAEIQLKQNQNDFDYKVLVNLQGSISNLGALFNDNLYKIRMTHPNCEVNAYMIRLGNSQEKYEEIIDPGVTARREAQKAKINTKGYWSNVFITFIAWLFKQYLKNFFIAFVLLWIWWYQEQKSIKITNPLSFLMCLLFYPIVIVRTWCMRLNDTAKYLIMTIEYRRRSKDLFALFSENEIAELKKLAKTKLNLSDYRLILNESGLIVRHALVPAIIVSVLFVSLPEKSFSSVEIKFEFNFNQNQIELSQTAQTDTLVNTNIDYDSLNFDFIIIEAYKIPIAIEKLISRLIYYADKCLSGHKRRLKPIPLFINN